MSFAPGVYLQEIPRAKRAPLDTGVPAFLGVKGISEVVRLDAWGDHPDDRIAGYTRFAVRGFFANGGRRCYLVPESADLALALARLDAHEEVDLLCAPELVSTLAGVGALAGAQAQIVSLAAESRRLFAILDGPEPRAGSTPGGEGAHQKALAAGLAARPGAASYGALYVPWIEIEGACPICDGTGRVSTAVCPKCAGSTTGAVPPSGHIAGVYARTDRSIGVFGAPANTVVAGAVDVDGYARSARGGDFAGDRVNVVRSFPGRGVRIWGARTLSDDPSYRYINVRRLILTLGRWLERTMTDLVFEPQGPLVWLRLSRQLDAVLRALFQRGALAGATEAEAYYVKCDEETNPPDVQRAGQVVAEIGLAAARPSEFIRVDVIQGERGVRVADLG